MNLLLLARAKAERRSLAQAQFRVTDIEALDPSAEMFDVAICVFGIFFLPDMPAGVRCLWRLVRPGGQLAITTWGPRFGDRGIGVEVSDVEAESSVQPLQSPDDFWTIVLGCGFRANVEQLNLRERERVLTATVNVLLEHNVCHLETNAVFAIARKPT